MSLSLRASPQEEVVCTQLGQPGQKITNNRNWFSQSGDQRPEIKVLQGSFLWGSLSLAC